MAAAAPSGHRLPDIVLVVPAASMDTDIAADKVPVLVDHPVDERPDKGRPGIGSEDEFRVHGGKGFRKDTKNAEMGQKRGHLRIIRAFSAEMGQKQGHLRSAKLPDDKKHRRNAGAFLYFL